MFQIKRAVLLPLLVCVAAAWSRAAEPVPSPDEAHQQFTDGKYKDAVRTLARIVASKEWQAKKFDKFDVLSLKAEAHLQLKESLLAATTFEAAAKETTDKRAAALARTTAYLIRHSVGTHYVPRATANKRIAGKSPDERITIEIVDPKTRKEALTALWQDERNAADPKFKLAGEGDSMQAVVDAAPLISHLDDFDLAANGSDDDTKQAGDRIAGHGRDLLAAMVEKMGIRIDEITTKAMKLEHISQPVWRRHGLENNEPVEVKEMVSKTDKIALAIKVLTSDLSLDADFFAHVVKEAARVHDKAKATLEFNYGETYFGRPPN